MPAAKPVTVNSPFGLAVVNPAPDGSIALAVVVTRNAAGEVKVSHHAHLATAVPGLAAVANAMRGFGYEAEVCKVAS